MLPVSTRTFCNGGNTAVCIPAEFGIKPGEEVVLSQDEDGTVHIARTAPFAGFFAAIERMRAEGNDPAHDAPLVVPRMRPPRKVDLGYVPSNPRKRKRTGK